MLTQAGVYVISQSRTGLQKGKKTGRHTDRQTDRQRQTAIYSDKMIAYTAV